MGQESIRDGKWYPEAILNDLIESGGLSAKSVGCDITDREARRFFYDKIPFALVAWQADNYAIVAFDAKFGTEVIETIVDAFIKILGYSPFVCYDIFQNEKDFGSIFEWSKKDVQMKMAEITKLPQTKNIRMLTDKYIMRDIAR